MFRIFYIEDRRDMNKTSRRMVICILLLILTLFVAGCATGRRDYAKGVDAMRDKNYDLAVAELTQALKANPDDAEFNSRLATARGLAAQQHLKNGRVLRSEEKYLEAASELRLASALDPTLDVAQLEFRQVEKLIEARKLATEAQENLHARRLNKAGKLADEALAIDPENALALEVVDKLQQKEEVLLGGFELDVDSKEPITLKFKEAKVKEVFKILNRLSGINFIFDEELENELVSLLLEDATFSQALELLMKMNNIGIRVLNPKTVIVYPNSKEKQKQYEDQIIQTFYLSSIDAKKAVNMLRTMLQLRKIYVHEELNAIVVRDTPDVIELVSQILATADLADSEVMFDLELIEVSRGDELHLGIEPDPYGVSAAIVKNGDIVASGIPSSGVGNMIHDLDGTETFFTLPTASFEMAKTLTDTIILATPKIRVKNREKAKVHVGTREPSVTSTISGDNVSTNVQYVDVGIKVDVEPVIQLDNTIQTKLKLEVSSVSDRQVVGGTNNPTTVFTISTTNAETALILKDGERTIIGGLIRNADTKSKKTIPVLGEIPLIGALFSKYDTDDGKREILLSVTPHIVKKVDVPGEAESRIWSGGEEELKAGQNFAAFAVRPELDDVALPAPAIPTPPVEQVSPTLQTEQQRSQLNQHKSELEQQRLELEQQRSELDQQRQKFEHESAQLEQQSPQIEQQRSELEQQRLELEQQRSELEAQSPQIEQQRLELENKSAQIEEQATQIETQVAPTPPAEPQVPQAGVPLVPETTKDREQVAQVVVQPPEIKVPVQSANLFVNGPELVNAGDEFAVTLQVAEVDKLYSAPLFVNYDPQFLDFVRADEGDFLRTPGQSTVFTSSPNRSRGELIIGNKQGAGGEGASGSGSLARIYFKAKQTGNVVIRPNRVNFRDPAGARMPVEAKPFNLEIR